MNQEINKCGEKQLHCEYRKSTLVNVGKLRESVNIQCRPINKYTRFLFTHFSISSIALYNVVKINAIEIYATDVQLANFT